MEEPKIFSFYIIFAQFQMAVSKRETFKPSAPLRKFMEKFSKSKQMAKYAAYQRLLLRWWAKLQNQRDTLILQVNLI